MSYGVADKLVDRSAVAIALFERLESFTQAGQPLEGARIVPVFRAANDEGFDGVTLCIQNIEMRLPPSTTPAEGQGNEWRCQATLLAFQPTENAEEKPFETHLVITRAIGLLTGFGWEALEHCFEVHQPSYEMYGALEPETANHILSTITLPITVQRLSGSDIPSADSATRSTDAIPAVQIFDGPGQTGFDGWNDLENTVDGDEDTFAAGSRPISNQPIAGLATRLVYDLTEQFSDPFDIRDFVPQGSTVERIIVEWRGSGWAVPPEGPTEAAGDATFLLALVSTTPEVVLPLPLDADQPLTAVFELEEIDLDEFDGMEVIVDLENDLDDEDLLWEVRAGSLSIRIEYRE